MKPEVVTAILNAHQEGLLARASLLSLKRSAEFAQTAGFSVEIIIVLDRGDEHTLDVIKQHMEASSRLLVTDYGDPGKARNFAVSEARGDYIAFLDADDLWGANWLLRAAQCASVREDPVIWHPELSVYFGETKQLFHHVDMESAQFSWPALMVENYWTVLSFGRRELYASNPYPDTDIAGGFGFEDWAWNMTTVSKGIVHKVVPGTGHVIRSRAGSVSSRTLLAHAVPPPTALLKTYLEKRDTFFLNTDEVLE